MRGLLARLATALVLFAFPYMAGGQDPAATPEPGRKDLAEFSRLIHARVVAQMPKEFEEHSNWGQTIPIPDKLRLPRLQRVRVQMGDHEELPHGLWRRHRVWLDDPDKDVRIAVQDVKQLDAKTFRLSIDADANLRTETDLRQWQKGLQLLNVTAEADATLLLHIDCDVGLVFNTSKFPPELNVEPKVTNLTMDLANFNLHRIAGGIIIEGQMVRDLGDEVKGVIQRVVKSKEAEVKDRANEAIARSLKEGKGNISAASLLEMLGNAKSNP